MVHMPPRSQVGALFPPSPVEDEGISRGSVVIRALGRSLVNVGCCSKGLDERSHVLQALQTVGERGFAGLQCCRFPRLPVLGCRQKRFRLQIRGREGRSDVPP